MQNPHLKDDLVITRGMRELFCPEGRKLVAVIYRSLVFILPLHGPLARSLAKVTLGKSQP